MFDTENLKDNLFYLGGFTGYSKLMDIDLTYSHIITNASMHHLSIDLPDLQIGMHEFYDGLLMCDNHKYFFYFLDQVSDIKELKTLFYRFFSFNKQGYFYNLKKDSYLDPINQYNRIEEIKPIKYEIEINQLLEAMLMSLLTDTPLKINSDYKLIENESHYFFRIIIEECILNKVLYKGLSLMSQYCLLEYYLPELSALRGITHDKDYHPEGDAFDHTLECLKYYNSKNITLGWSIILHDLGKAIALSNKRQKFVEHAQLGGKIAKRVLYRMGYDDEFIQNVIFLVDNHMLPIFIPHMKSREKEKLISHPLFKELLQLFKFDILGSHKDMNYYNRIKTALWKGNS